ncbi:twist-related protein 1-like [Ostrinia furnacalis]|uniref:twist-related protein 1-like n=1 Tax=Ostrinia furnacalis TaxID=93504 RepID=UPI00103C829C|nr:twist-related protein 1-like [Ostrinia furnacalis]
MSYETCDNKLPVIKLEDTTYLQEDKQYYLQPTQVEITSEFSHITPPPPTLLSELTSSSDQPFYQPWSSNLTINSIPQNNQQIQYALIPQYQNNLPEQLENGTFQDNLSHNNYNVDGDNNLGLEADNSIPKKEANCETEKLKTWRLPPKSNKVCNEEVEELRIQRLTANERERHRTYNLNEAFATLRRIIPLMPTNKLTKMQILELAKRYIEFLCYMLSKPGTGDKHVKDTQARLNHAFTMRRLERNPM